MTYCDRCGKKMHDSRHTPKMCKKCKQTLEHEAKVIEYRTSQEKERITHEYS